MRTAGHSHESYSKFELRIVMLCSMAGTLMQALDSTIANVALPYMQGSLAASRDQITWVLTSYIVAAAIMTAPVGWIAARFGRKNFAIISLAGFTIASMMCGAAQTLNEMILFRLIQGAFGAALSPLSQSIMLDLYPPEKRGAAMAIWGMGVMVGPILGPTLGGYLTDAYDWRWVFYVNLPFGIATGSGSGCSDLVLAHYNSCSTAEPTRTGSRRPRSWSKPWWPDSAFIFSSCICSPRTNPSCRARYSRIAISSAG
jgi:DHA2 family multidrug resistance protein